MTETAKTQPCQAVAPDTAICCPTKDSTLVSEHPRVYLQADESGKATCPYCGTCYQTH